jgi:hypothetical protein
MFVNVCFVISLLRKRDHEFLACSASFSLWAFRALNGWPSSQLHLEIYIKPVTVVIPFWAGPFVSQNSFRINQGYTYWQQFSAFAGFQRLKFLTRFLPAEGLHLAQGCISAIFPYYDLEVFTEMR